jgi:hypothetical protein
VVWHKPFWAMHISSSESTQFNVNCAVEFLMYCYSAISRVRLHHSIIDEVGRICVTWPNLGGWGRYNASRSSYPCGSTCPIIEVSPKIEDTKVDVGALGPTYNDTRCCMDPDIVYI